MRMSDLADAAVLPPATVTRYVDKLAERALVVRRIAPEDKRSVVAGLSDLGVSLAEHLSKLEQEATRSLESILGQQQLVALMNELSRLS